MRRHSLPSIALFCLLGGCYTGVGGPGASGGDDGDDDDAGDDDADDDAGDDDGPDEPFQTSVFECDPTQTPTDLPLRRLSRVQYENALGDLATILVGAEGAETLLDAAANRLLAIPTDVRSGPDAKYGGLSRLDQSIFQETVEGTYRVGDAIGKTLVASPSMLEVAAGPCATDADPGNDAQCMADFVARFAPRVLRRPLTDADIEFYVDVAGDTLEVEDYADIVTVLLASPELLYFVEQGLPDESGPGTRLTAHELAARLSFHFWQTIPDDELVALADSGELLDDDVYEAQVERMVDDARTRDAIGEVYGEWLDSPNLHELDAAVGEPAYDAFLDGFTPGPDTRTHMADEVREMAAYYTLESPGSFEEWFRSDKSFARTEDIASIYGVAPWTDGEPPTLPDGREGVITRALALATGSAVTHPILKGVYARKTILCDVLPPPPADAMTVAMGVEDVGLGARAYAQAISEARGDCASCHETLVNPMGFITEDFDALGRHRTIENVYDKTTGELIGTAEIDTNAVPRVTADDDRPASTAAELNQYLLESERPQACFARRYFRFTFGRIEDDTSDGCSLATLHQALLDGTDLGTVVREIAMRPEFRTKTFEGE